jgi:uncharacterized protein (DUF433 family)
MSSTERKVLGHYIVVDPEVCHGKPTFVGTRIMVAQVLRQVARGIDWDTIMNDWRGSISREAIAEAVALANRAFSDHAREYIEQESEIARKG